MFSGQWIYLDLLTFELNPTTIYLVAYKVEDNYTRHLPTKDKWYLFDIFP